MGNLFNVDNGFFTFMGKVCDMVYLSILWLICCIPLITIGPATTAMYYTIVKTVRRDRGYVTKEFFHSFKVNFKLGTISTVIFLVLSYVLYVDFNFANAKRLEGETSGELLFAGFIAITTIAVFVFLFAYPILSRFTLNLRGLFKTSFVISLKHFPSTFLIALTVAAFGIGIYLIPLLIFIAPSLSCFISSFLIERIFKKYMPKPEGTPEETGRDQWYWE